jgi:phosphoglycerate dehydrogenase-like enzyme
MGVEMMPTLEALLVQSDFMTIHLPRTPETEGLIGTRGAPDDEAGGLDS